MHLNIIKTSVDTELASCFSFKKMWFHLIPHFIKFLSFLHPLATEREKKLLLGTAVFIACVWTAEITAGMTSLLSTCRHFAGSLLNIRDVTRCSSSRKISSWYILLTIGCLVLVCKGDVSGISERTWLPRRGQQAHYIMENAPTAMEVGENTSNQFSNCIELAKMSL